MAYDLNLEELGEIKIHVKKFFLYPKSWIDPENLILESLHWQSIEFREEELNNIPEKKGVYCFILEPNVNNFINTKYLFYVGQTVRTLKTRFKEYIDDLKGKGKPRQKVFKMFKLYNGYLKFYYTEIDNDESINNLEKKLLNTFVPYINTQIPKARIKNEYQYLYE